MLFLAHCSFPGASNNVSQVRNRIHYLLNMIITMRLFLNLCWIPLVFNSTLSNTLFIRAMFGSLLMAIYHWGSCMRFAVKSGPFIWDSLIGHIGHSEEENACLSEFPVICSAFFLLHGFDYLDIARWFK